MPPKAKPGPLLTGSTRSPSDLQKRRRLSLGPMPLMRQNRRAYFQAFCKALKNPNGDSESGGAAQLLGPKLLRLADTSIGVSKGFSWVSGSLVAIKLRKRNRFQREREKAYRVE